MSGLQPQVRVSQLDAARPCAVRSECSTTSIYSLQQQVTERENKRKRTLCAHHSCILLESFPGRKAVDSKMQSGLLQNAKVQDQCALRSSRHRAMMATQRAAADSSTVRRGVLRLQRARRGWHFASLVNGRRAVGENLAQRHGSCLRALAFAL